MEPENLSPDLSGQKPEQARSEQPARKTARRAKRKAPAAAKERKPRRRAKPAKVEGPEESTAPVKTTPRRRAVRSVAAKIPPILLEGDVPPVEVRKVLAGVPGQDAIQSVVESATGAEAQPRFEVEGTKEVILVARDPRSLYVHWDLSGRQEREYCALSADGTLVLRIFAGSLDGSLITQVKLPAGAFHCFVDVPAAGTRYQAELGYNDKAGRWVRISASGIVVTPPEEGVVREPIKFATIPLETPLTALAGLAKKPSLEYVTRTEAVDELGTGSLVEKLGQVEAGPETRAGAPEHRPSIESSTAKAAGQLGSEAAVKILPSQVELGISSPISEAQAGRRFWFNVNAELVVYGATEPDAQVTLGGLPVKLRPDGTFSYRIALPDGQHQLTAEAVSADKIEKRTARFIFTRATEYTSQSQ